MMRVAKDYNEIKWTVEDVFGTKMKVSEPLAMASAAGCMLVRYVRKMIFYNHLIG